MIAYLQGKLIYKQPPFMVLDVNGVGYELEAPMMVFFALPDIGESTIVFVHMVVREDAQLLFAFTDLQQRDVFRSLIKISGVGPKVALAILSTLTIEELMQCLAAEDLAQLVRVPGIGKKTAERLLIELRNRFENEMQAVGSGVGSVAVTSANQAKQDAISALQALGYKSAEVAKVVRGLEATDSSEHIIRQALKVLSGKVL